MSIGDGMEAWAGQPIFDALVVNEFVQNNLAEYIDAARCDPFIPLLNSLEDLSFAS